MDKRKMSKISAALAVLMVLAIFLLMRGSLRRTAHIVLPETVVSSGESEESQDPSGSGIAVVEINTRTVQTAIATLVRPAEYRRTVTVEQFWSGGSGSLDTTVAVRGALTRTDRVLPGGRTRHAITDGENTYIWYDNQTQVFTAQAGDISSDDEQTIPTYETILDLPTASIAAADYQDYQGVLCIFVETEAEEDGYFQRFWISVDTGLLAAAERYQHEELIYRMTGLTVETAQPEAALFTLPDGTSLI